MKLFVADFDRTLFLSPDPPSWFTAYWWGSARSLNPPCVPTVPDDSWWNADMVATAHEAIADPNTFTMLLTGRGAEEANFKDRVPELLRQQGLDFDLVALRQDPRSKEWKLTQIVKQLSKDNYVYVELWDDRQNHLEWLTRNIQDFGYDVAPYLVETRPHNCGGTRDITEATYCPPGASTKPGWVYSRCYAERTSDSCAPKTTRRCSDITGAAVGKSTGSTPRNLQTLKLAQEPEEPSEAEMVEELEEDPGANWKELYLQPVIRAIRNRFDLQEGQVTLLSPRKETPYGSDTLGFVIVGHVQFNDFEPSEDEVGAPPYQFYAQVNPAGELLLPVKIQGH